MTTITTLIKNEDVEKKIMLLVLVQFFSTIWDKWDKILLFHISSMKQTIQIYLK